MSTYKFMARGATAPFSGARWPEPAGGAPGAWVEAVGTLEQCRCGAHVCRPVDLAHWLHDELWETEVDGDRLDGIDCLVVRRARLVRRIDAWHQGGAARFAEACAQHAAELTGGGADVRGFIDDAALSAQYGYTAVAAHACAMAAARLGDDEEQAYRRERLWQADWIVRRVLSPGE